MSYSSIIALGLLIEKFNEFIEWIFQKRKKTEMKQLIDLDSNLKKQFAISIFDVSESIFDELKIHLVKMDTHMLDEIIISLSTILFSKTKNQMFRRLRSNIKLDKRILELIQFAAHNRKNLSLEIRNIQNTLNHRKSLT